MQADTTNRRLVKFIVAAVLFFAWNTIMGALQSQGPIHAFLEQGPARIIVGAHVHIGLVGWVSLLLAAVVYYLIPVLARKPVAAPRLIDGLFWAWVVTITLMGILMIAAGISGGNAFAAKVPGPQLEAILAPYMISLGIIGIICAIVALIFVVQVLVSVLRKA